MSFKSILVHRARPVGTRARALDPSQWVDGDPGAVEEEMPAFACCVFLPQGSETGTGRGRNVREPTLLYGERDLVGNPVALRPESSVLIVAPELNVAEGLPAETELRWEITGSAQPFGRPGRSPVVGFQVTIRRITD